MFRIIAAACLTALVALPASAHNYCPLCGAAGQTLAGEINVADFILLGKPTNPIRTISPAARPTS